MADRDRDSEICGCSYSLFLNPNFCLSPKDETTMPESVWVKESMP
jgi:hypothetical protein